MGANRPQLVIEVELRIHLDEIHVGLIVGVERADVPPVGVPLAVLVAKREGLHAMRVDQPWQEVVAEVVAAAAVVGIEPELLEEEVGRKAVDAHRGEGPGRIGAIGGRIGHLFAEAANTARSVYLHRAKLGRLLAGHRQRPHGDISAAGLMGVDERLVVHLVDVVAGEHDHEPGGRLLE